MLRIASFAALLAIASAGIVGGPAYAAAPLGYAAPIAKVHAPLAYAAPVYPGYQVAAAPLAYAAPAPLAYAAAAPLAYAAPVAKVVAPVVAKAVVAEEYDPNPQYSYGYSIQDGLTGDSKGHQESRQGDVVQGQYSLVEPDGAVRTVTYTSDPVNGFNAVVDRQAPAVAIAKVAAPVYAAAPAIAKVHAAPVAFGAAPVAYAG